MVCPYGPYWEHDMKKILTAILLALPMVAAADYLDVIEFKLNEGCSFETELQIVKDFNTQWGAKNGYRAEILMPIESHNLVSMYWIGRTENAAAFGKAWDTWRDELKDPNSVAGKLAARFGACGTNLARRGYDIYD